MSDDGETLTLSDWVAWEWKEYSQLRWYFWHEPVSGWQ